MPAPTAEDATLRAALKRLRVMVNAYLATKSADVDHKDVIKELYSRTDMSGSYVASLIFSNLIALLGLLSNSVAVVIGAMLISPLMGPIFSLGLAFAMGHLVLARKAARIIIISVVVTILSAAFLTILSPLKAATPEILSRTHPNIYDLLIAIFAGAIGAIALCTRKNYMFTTTTTGVAVATAVIPPLSVVGYGLGTWQLSMAMGGFFLFFTNLVAIVISSDVVFMLLRFRSSMVEESAYPLRLRLKILGVTLVLISIPLITTLVIDIRALKLSQKIEETLKSHLNLKGNSHLVGFSFNKENDGLNILASVNTVTEFDAISEKRLESALANETDRPVALELEQVLVKAGAIKKQEKSPAKNILAPPLPPVKETLANLRGKTMGIIREACGEAGVFLSPWPVQSCGVSFNDVVDTITLQLAVGRDFPLSEQEVRWLSLAINKKIEHPVVLQTATAPFLPELTLNDDGLPDEQGKKALMILKKLTSKKLPLQFTVNYPTGRQGATLADRKKARSLKAYLEKELGIPAERISYHAAGTAFRISVVADGEE